MSISNYNISTQVYQPTQEYQISQNNLNKKRKKLIKKMNLIINEISTSFDQPIKEKQNNINIALKKLNKVNQIAAKYGDDTIIRLKSGKFKNGEASGFLKRMMNGDRYQTERQAAAEIANIKGGKASAFQVKSDLQEQIANNENIIASLKVERDKLQFGFDTYKLEFDKTVVQMRGIALFENSKNKTNQITIQNRNDFSLIYQSNAGCKALNANARFMNKLSSFPGKLRASVIISEYKAVHGDDIFSEGNATIKSSIERLSSNLNRLVETGTKLWYTPTDKNITTYRSQGMTSRGIQQLISQFNNDKSNDTSTSYELGQFFSTLASNSLAQDFTNRSKDDIKVIFEINGNSANGIFVTGGLNFNKNEGEKLYSPLANFKVKSIKKEASGIYQVNLQEVPRQKDSLLLPY